MKGLSAVALAVYLVLCCNSNASAQEQKEIQLDIQAEMLADALNEWARVSGYQLIGPASATKNLPAPRLQGTFAAKAALEKLLAGTQLTYEFIDQRTVAIQARPAAATPIGSTGIEAKRSQGGGDPRLAFAFAPAEERPAGGGVDRTRDTLEEVIVTAQKRVERLQDVPISISVLGGVELDKSTAEGITDAINRVAGVSAIQYSQQGGGTSMAVRGVAASSPTFNGAAPVAYYLDAVPFGLVKSAIAPDASAYDMERVEVLRGPQGTLYGSSALNGVVRVLTHDPNLRELEFKARTSAAGVEYGSESYRGDVALNVPIVDGKLGVRAVAGYQDLSGWIDQPIKQDANDAQIATMRAKVGAQPTDSLSVVASAWSSRTDYGAPNLADDNRFRDTSFDESITTDYDVYG